MARPRIGVFDSGLGGLGVWREIVRALPAAPTVYWADQAYVPYGGRSPAFLNARAEAAVRALRAHGASLIVVACNTATAVSLAALRRAHPEIPFVGMEPAVKPAAKASATGVVGVLATRTTLDAPGFRALLERHAGGVRVVARAGDGLVEAVEAGVTTGPEVERAVAACVTPMRAEGVDRLVLGCTHYPFLREVIAMVAGLDVTLVDPAPAVARQAARLWSEADRQGSVEVDDVGAPDHLLLTTADPAVFARGFGAVLGDAMEGRVGFAAAAPAQGPQPDPSIKVRQKT